MVRQRPVGGPSEPVDGPVAAMARRMVVWASVIGGAAALGGPALAQDQRSVEAAAMACIERLQLPEYPPIAASARVTGDVVVRVRLGTSREVLLEWADAASRPLLSLFDRAIERAVDESTFSPACGGRSIALVFEFRLTQEKVPDEFRAVAFRFPNRFEIIAVSPSPWYRTP